MYDEILKPRGLKYQDLTPAEKETLNTWVDTLNKSKVTIEMARANVQAMREAVENELSEMKPSFFSWFFGWKRDYLLKARLRNYLLLEAFLSTHEKAKAAMERAMAGFAGVDNK
jgi:hypothetical protein